MTEQEITFENVFSDCCNLLEDTISSWKPTRSADALMVIAEIVDDKISGNRTVVQIFANSPELWQLVPKPCDGMPIISIMREVLRQELFFRLDVMADGLSVKYGLDWF